MRRPAPWIHRFSRPLIGLVAALGVADTAYLTSVKLGHGSVACSSQSCNEVLSSPYANIFGFPLSLFGLLAYLAMVVMSVLPLVINAKSNKKLHNQAQDLTWTGLFLGGTAMMIFSGYLMYLLTFVIKAPCPYCIASAAFATLIFILVLIGREWDQLGSLIMNGLIVSLLTLLATFSIYSSAGVSITPETPTSKNITSLATQGGATKPYGWTILSQSGESELALAAHLKKIGAKMYGAFWCPHCYEQKQLFGREAFKTIINYVECAEGGVDPQIDICHREGIEGFPTWDIQGKKYPQVMPLEKLAEISGYTGPQNFQYSKLIPGFSNPKPPALSGEPQSSPAPSASP
jgi:uncharacterized membrane protein